MTTTEIEARIKSTLMQILGVKESSIESQSSLQDDLGADSLDMVELTMALEDEFNIEIPDQDVEKVKVVQDVVEYITKKLEASNA